MMPCLRAYAGPHCRRRFGATAIHVLPDPKVDPWPTLWASFELALDAKHAGQISPRTLDVYRDGAGLFHDWSEERNLPTDPAVVRKQQIEEFVVWLVHERMAKPATVANRLSSLRTFFNWCVREEVIEHSPMARIETPKVDESAPEILTEDEERRLIDACRGGGFEDRRDMAIIRLMLNTGMRRFEVAAITLADVDLKEGIAKIVRGRGGKSRKASFDAMTAQAIDRYLRSASTTRRPNCPTCGWHRKARCRPMDCTTFSSVVLRWVASSGGSGHTWQGTRS